MVSVTIRFLSALFGSLAAFFLAGHALRAMGVISPYMLSRVDEFYIMLLHPIMTIDPLTQKTLIVLSVALLAQALVIFGLFRMWDRQPQSKLLDIIPVEHASSEIPERLRAAHADAEMPSMRLVTEDGPSRRAMDAVRMLAARQTTPTHH